MELLRLLRQFDGSHYKTLETDINLLLEQISSEDLMGWLRSVGSIKL